MFKWADFLNCTKLSLLLSSEFFTAQFLTVASVASQSTYLKTTENGNVCYRFTKKTYDVLSTERMFH
jgi:hypothetical protein